MTTSLEGRPTIFLHPASRPAARRGTTTAHGHHPINPRTHATVLRTRHRMARRGSAARPVTPTSVFQLPRPCSLWNMTSPTTPCGPTAGMPSAPRRLGRAHGSESNGAQRGAGRRQRCRQDHPAREPAVRGGCHRPQGQRRGRHHGRRRQRRGARPTDEHRGQRGTPRVPWARLHRAGLPRLGRVRSGRLQRRARLRRRGGGGRAGARADDRRRPAAAVPGRARHSAPRVHQQDGPLGGPLPRPAADPARTQRPTGGPAPVRDRPRRGSGRLCRSGERGGARLPPRPGFRRDPGAGRLSASASRPPAARCWRRWPISTTT